MPSSPEAGQETNHPRIKASQRSLLGVYDKGQDQLYSVKAVGNKEQMHSNRQVAHYFRKKVQYSMISILNTALFYNNCFNIKITNMQTQTPMKLLDNNPQPFKLTSTMRKQPTSHELTRQFLEERLAAREKKLQVCQQKIKEQTEKIENLQKSLKEKDKQISNKNDTISTLKKKIGSLEEQLAKTIGSLHQKNKSISKKELESIKQKQEQGNHEKLNKLLTKENAELITERHQFKTNIEELTERLCKKQEQIASQISNSALLARLNEDLKLQVEELLFEIRMVNRRQETNKLIQYEDQISYRGLKQQQSQESEHQQGSENQLIELLKLKIGSLEQQLQVSDRRCKQLQTIVLSQ